MSKGGKSVPYTNRTMPIYAVIPEGTSAAPALQRFPMADFPAPRERVDLLTRIDWGWVKCAIDAGDTVAIVVDATDTGALLDTIENRLGWNVAVRVTDGFVVWVARRAQPL